MSTRLRIVFLGSGAFGVPTLRWLASRHSVVGVVSQPDKPAGRGGALTPTPIAAVAEQELAGVPLIRTMDVNEPGTVGTLHGLMADAWVVIAFGQKLSRGLLEGQRAMNLHASLLPRWRGAAPIHAAMVAGDPVTGNSVITLADKMDAGLVLAQSEHAIGPTATMAEMHDVLAADGPALVGKVLERASAEWPFGEVQDPARVTLAGKLSKADGWVDFGADGEVCRRRINGLSPWPGVTATFRGESLRLLRAAPARGHGAPGAVIDAAAGTVACGPGSAIRLMDVQPSGKRAMTWAEFANGKRIVAGELIAGISNGESAC